MEIAVRIAAQHLPFGAVQRALDELHHAQFHAVAEYAQAHAECGGGFALAGAGIDDQQAFFLLRRRLFLFETFFVTLRHALVRIGIGFHAQLQWVAVMADNRLATRARLAW